MTIVKQTINIIFENDEIVPLQDIEPKIEQMMSDASQCLISQNISEFFLYLRKIDHLINICQ